MIKRENCAFYREYFCMALTEKNCANCPFYKTKEQLEQSRAKAQERICKRPDALYFIRKYDLGIK